MIEKESFKTILSDVFSLTKPKIVFAKKGENVKIIRINKPAVIVENLKGEKFSTTLNNILENG